MESLNQDAINEDYKLLEVASVRLVHDAPILSNTRINSSEDAVNLLAGIMKDFNRETVFVINLNARLMPINCTILSVGCFNEAVADPKLLIQNALLSNANNMIILHNHPTGDASPSIYDCRMTDRFAKACQLMGFNLCDHIIVGAGKQPTLYSFAERGMLPKYSLNYATRPEDIAFNKVAEKRTKYR